MYKWFACLPTAYVAWFPIGHRLVPVHGPGVGDLCARRQTLYRQQFREILLMVGLKRDSNSKLFIFQYLHASFTRTRTTHIRFLHAQLSHNGKSRALFSLKSMFYTKGQPYGEISEVIKLASTISTSSLIPISTIHFFYIILSTVLRNSLHAIRSGEHWETLNSLRSLF